MHIDIDILVYAIIAVFLLGRLWAVLGTRNDTDQQRPNPFTPPVPKPAESEPSFVPPLMPGISRLTPVGLPPASLAGGLAQIEALDKNFNEKQFLLNAQNIFTNVVEAYAAGSLDALNAYVAPDFLAHFQKSIEARKQDNQTAESRVVRIKVAEILSARAEDVCAFLTVKFVSDQENILRDQAGTVIGGTEGQAEEISDIWVFARDMTKSDARWLLVETRS